MGDFNLDVNMDLRPDYSAKIPLSHLTTFVNDNNLTQIVDINTWSRTIIGIKKESRIDHIYTDDITLVRSLTSKTPTFGDHLLVIAELELLNGVESKLIIKRNWSNYSRSGLISLLNFGNDLINQDVQSQWNYIENVIIKAADMVAPLISQSNVFSHKPNITPTNVKNKMNKRKRLLRLNGVTFDAHRSAEIKVLNKEINAFFVDKKKKKVKGCVRGPKPDIWKAVRAAKDININQEGIPMNLTLAGVRIPVSEIANSFAAHFRDKIKLNVL